MLKLLSWKMIFAATDMQLEVLDWLIPNQLKTQINQPEH